MKMALWLYQINKSAGFLPLIYFKILTFAKCPHEIAFRETGVCIVALGDKKDAENKQNEVWESLFLLQKSDPRRMRRLKENVGIIYVADYFGEFSYVPIGKICVLNLNKISADYTIQTRRIFIIGAIINAATFGFFDRQKFPIYGNTCRRINRICNREQDKIVTKLRRF
jgi:hypothetical protein